MQNYLFINKNQENSRYYVILKGYRTFLNSTMKNLHSSHPTLPPLPSLPPLPPLPPHPRPCFIVQDTRSQILSRAGEGRGGGGAKDECVSLTEGRESMSTIGYFSVIFRLYLLECDLIFFAVTNVLCFVFQADRLNFSRFSCTIHVEDGP